MKHVFLTLILTLIGLANSSQSAFCMSSQGVGLHMDEVGKFDDVKLNCDIRWKTRNKEEKKFRWIGFIMSSISFGLLLFPNAAIAVFVSFIFGMLGGLICLSVFLSEGFDDKFSILGFLFGTIGFFWAVKQIQKTRL